MRQKMLHVSRFVIILLVILGLIGCEFFEKPHNGNPSSPVEAEQAANFSVSPATGDRFGVALGLDAFLVRTLPGDYLLTYTTQLGTFYIPYRALETAKLTIGLQPNDIVLDITIQPGTITDISQGTTFEDDTVTALPWPGSGIVVNWQDVFSVDISLPLVVLVQGGQVVESEQVEDLTGGQSTTFGVYAANGNLQIFAPRGDFLVEYTTTHGTFHVVFRAYRQTFVTIPLQSNDTVFDVSIRRGVIPYDAEPLDDQGDVKIYIWPGASPTLVWSDVFIININIFPIILVQGGEVVTDNPIVIVLPGMNELPGGFDPGEPGEFGGGGGGGAGGDDDDDDDDDDDGGGGRQYGRIIIIIIIIG